MKLSMMWKSFTLFSSVAFHQGERCVSSSCSRVESRALEYFARELGQLMSTPNKIPTNFFVPSWPVGFLPNAHGLHGGKISRRVDARFPMQPPLAQEVPAGGWESPGVRWPVARSCSKISALLFCVTPNGAFWQWGGAHYMFDIVWLFDGFFLCPLIDCILIVFNWVVFGTCVDRCLIAQFQIPIDAPFCLHDILVNLEYWKQ